MSDARPLRVLVLAERLDIAGGVERFVCALANRLAAEGMAVTVGTVDTAREAVRYALAPSVTLRRARDPLPTPSREGEGGRASRAWRLLRAQWRTGRALARLTREADPDAVVLNGLTTACSALLFHRGHAARTICCDHNHFDARSGLWRRLRRRLYPAVGAVVSLTEADAARFRALNPRTHVIHNASMLRADAPANPAALRVLAVGRFVAQKGVDLLLRAWPEVLRAQPDASLRIVGDGPERDALHALAGELGVEGRVQWCAPTPDIARHYREAAVFVLPSRYEGMPLALLEAQALGVPSVAFDCPTGPAEILDDETGVLVPPGDVPALAAALARLLADPALRARMGRAAIARSRSRFSPEAHDARWIALVREVAAAPARAPA